MSGENRLDFTATSNGHDTAVVGNPAFDQVEMRRVNKAQVEVQEKKDGEVVATVRDAVSKDGNELTITTVSRGRPDQVAVWTRSGGAHVPHDPFSGEWTEDASKTLLRQGLVLRITPDAGGAVHFVGDQTYTAHFDGKPYEVRNSRNDTVSLALPNPHTVEATYRRDNQVTQRDRWVISADGRQMTLTSTATYETGQHLNEKLTFQRQ